MSRFVELFEMIRARGLDFDSQARGAGIDELLGVNARNEAGGASGFENFA